MHPTPRSRRFVGYVAAVLFAVLALRAADTAEKPIDWDKARALHQKDVAGEALTSDERAYLERAMAARRAQSPMAAVLAQLPPDEQQQVRQIMQKRQSGEPLTEAERALQEKVRGLLARQAANGPASPSAGQPPQPPRDHTGLVPLSDMTSGQTYHGRDGGLYGGGRNTPPPALAEAALAEAKRITPLDPAGHPAPGAQGGRIVLLSVGMSNTTQEFSRFKEFADRDPAKSPEVLIVDGAQGGQAAAQWVESADNHVWQTVESRLKAAGATPSQVEAVWLKQAEIRPTEPFPGDAEHLAKDEATIVRMLKQKFPNLRIVYLSSRIYGGYATTALNPEPFAYDGAFAVRDLIQKQAAGDPTLNWDAARGPATAPLLLWGPYLWADGVTPRKTDGLVWRREDLREDGTHPSATTGRDKVARLLLAFLKTDPSAAPWFTGR